MLGYFATTEKSRSSTPLASLKTLIVVPQHADTLTTTFSFQNECFLVSMGSVSNGPFAFNLNIEIEENRIR